ncbi:two-partner secretion domain-containing protein [Phormidesmis priestleyi]
MSLDKTLKRFLCDRLSLFSSLFRLLLACNSTQAQVIPDGTLNTIVTSPISGNFTITNGSSAGNNLFHSFRKFSIPTGGTTTFNLVNILDVSTVFNRVTGSNVFNIGGLIKTINSNNPVSLFLINPNDIVFGQNARLDIGGSFAIAQVTCACGSLF